MGYSEELLSYSIDEFNRWVHEINKMLWRKELQMINMEEIYQQITECSSKAELLGLAACLKQSSLGGLLHTSRSNWGVDDILNKLYKYYLPVKVIKLEAGTQDNESNLEVSPSIFKKLDNTNIEEFIIDIPDVNRDNIKITNDKLMLLGQATNIVPDRYCVIVSKSNLLAVFPDGEEAIWCLRLECKEAKDTSNGLLVHRRNYPLYIIPSKLPTMYALSGRIITEKSCMETEDIKTRLAYYYGYGSDRDNYGEEVPVVYKYDGHNKYNIHSVIGGAVNIEKHKLINDVTKSTYIKVSKRLRDDKVNCEMAKVVDGSLNRLINRCLCAISRYIEVDNGVWYGQD